MHFTYIKISNHCTNVKSCQIGLKLKIGCFLDISIDFMQKIFFQDFQILRFQKTLFLPQNLKIVISTLFLHHKQCFFQNCVTFVEILMLSFKIQVFVAILMLKIVQSGN